ncbi:pogo transposable element with ZNF domain [Pangasianodon hypophthalmus]|uniref:pogo transposable element with ZNF domain n=1 Tax=Pangasianodon hypophthalmus TaxID=310915 RepID=UPI0023081E88|nr:pogo transposable element with ZNF domain [Pangasianodon hypophthalmus]
MSESEFYMQCEEEELAPCQSNTDETNHTENINHVHNGHVAASPEPSASPAPTIQAPAIKTALLPIVSGSVVPRPLLAGVLQPIQIAAGATKGQPIYIAPKPSAGTQQNIATPVGYILPAGQAVTFLTPTQAGSLISPQLASSSSTPQPAAVQIPVTIIHSPSAVQTITTVTSSGMPAVGTSPTTSLPHTSPAVSELPSTSSSGPPPPPAAADQAQNLLMQPANNVLAVGYTKTPSQVPTQVSSIKARARRSAFSATVSPKVFQNVFKAPQFCSRCSVAYKVVHELRGYMCHCNPELINSVHALTAKPRKRAKRAKRSSDPVQSMPHMHKSTISPPSSSTSASSRHLAASPPPPCLKHITASEIPEGVHSPGTGDYDAHGKLIMLVEDFYYGKDPGHPVRIENNQVPIMMKCHLCDKKLKNNIKLMNHMKHHMEMEQQRGDGKSHTMCQHCFRNFGTPFSLQCHLETVHSQVESAPLCKICELSYDNTPLFLHHMKNFHKPGEMPYMCQVCRFRSSFYYDVIIHFRELHKDTANLLCPYCLKVFKSSNSYQLHYNKHQKKSVLHCDKCRLQFLYAKDKAEHKLLFHQTHIKPVQLLGLKPGTKITIRAYSVTKVNDNTNFSKPSMNSESSSTSSVPAPQSGVQRITPTKRKPVESMLEVMTKFQRQCEPSRSWFCIECNFEIPDFSTHFPTFVHCSLCRYSTCCSRAYANHMISNHVPRKTTTKYLNLYKPCPKLGNLSCKTCGYSTEIGDLMATHLAKNPNHTFSHCRFNEGFSRGYKRFVFIPSDLIRKSQGLNSGIAIQKQEMQVDQNSLPQATNPVSLPNHCINPPDSSTHTPSIPSEVQPVAESTVPDENCGTQPKDLTLQKIALSSGAQTEAGAKPGESLTLAQLKIVLYALCFGVPQAASQFDSQPEEVQSLLLKRQLQLGPPKSREGLIPRASDRLAEWVLCQREQQLPVDEISLFSKAAQFMSADGGPGISYGWAVDFLINHDLSLQSLATSRRLLPHKVQERLHTFTSVINKQVTSHCLGLSAIAAMDELSIFIDMEQLDPASADSSSMMSAFKLVGDKDPLLDVVLASLADGTILPTVVFLRGEPLSPDAPALPDIILEAKPEGFSDEERLQLWFDKVWHRHVKPNSGGKGLLVMDPYRGHLSHKFLALLNSANTLPGIIPHACSCRLQPLEACVGLVLREFLQARWSQHVTEAPQDLIGAVPADLALLFSAWLLEMLDVLAERPEFLQRSFEPALNSNTELAPGGFSELVQNLTEALVVSTIQEQESNEPEAEDKGNMSSVGSPSLLPSPPNTQALKKIFEKDSDLDSFHGFEESEMIN